MPPRPGHALTLSLCLCATLQLGCESRFTYEDTRYTAADLPAAGAVPASDGWQSAPFPTPAQCKKDDGKAEPWLFLRGRETVSVEHGLGRAPVQLFVYVAYEDHGCAGTLASGDIARIEGADAKHIVIQNGTTEDFYMRLYLQ